jgi:hypothetical protein
VCVCVCVCVCEREREREREKLLSFLLVFSQAPLLFIGGFVIYKGVCKKKALFIAGFVFKGGLS